MCYIYSYSINCSKSKNSKNKRRAESCMFQAPCTRIGFIVSPPALVEGECRRTSRKGEC
jgi:hypothetical protein